MHLTLCLKEPVLLLHLTRRKQLSKSNKLGILKTNKQNAHLKCTNKYKMLQNRSYVETAVRSSQQQILDDNIGPLYTVLKK